MINIDIIRPVEVDNIIGLSCCEARVGYGNTLVLGFGERIVDECSNIHSNHGEWELRTESCSWRVNDKNKVLCGYYEDAKENDKILNELISKKIIEVMQFSLFDIILVFENGWEILLAGQAKDNISFGIFAPSEIFIEYNTNKGWKIKNSNEPCEGFDEKEQIFNRYSEDCSKRWENIIPKSEGTNHCNGCIYYRGLDGEFYFWDYGICSNGKSNHDGKLVGSKSGCSCFCRELNVT